MGITSDRLKELRLVDEIIGEPLGGAHRDYEATAYDIKRALLEHLAALQELSLDELVRLRHEKLRNIGFVQ